MKGFYERHMEELKTVRVNKGKNFLFPPHFHQSLEIFFVRKGEYVLSKNGERFLAKQGAIVFFDSFDVHSYDEEEENGEGTVLILPPSYLDSFSAWRGKKRIENPVLYDEALFEKLLKITDELFDYPNESVKKASAELFLAFLEEKLSLSEPNKRKDYSLFRQILDYAQRHFQEDINLSAVANALGYTPTYVSRIFHKFAKVGFPEYVNGLRLDFIERNLPTGKQISDLVFEAGFKSAQTYYRQKNNAEK